MNTLKKDFSDKWCNVLCVANSLDDSVWQIYPPTPKRLNDFIRGNFSMGVAPNINIFL